MMTLHLNVNMFKHMQEDLFHMSVNESQLCEELSSHTVTHISSTH